MHLIVTVTFAILTMMSIIASIMISNPMLLVLTLLFLVLLVPYIMHDQVYEANKSRPSVFYKKESIQGVYKHLFADVLRKLNIEEVQGF